MKKKNHKRRSKLNPLPTILLLILITLVSLVVLRWGILENLLVWADPIYLLPEFLAGMFYSSLFTSPLAVGAFLILGAKTNPITVALVGGLGAMVADLIILRVIRTFLFGHHFPLSQNDTFVYLIQKIRSTKLFRVFIPLIGVLFIASPFPDEIGLMLLGLTQLKIWQISIITFICNSLGILLIALTAKLLI